MRRNNIKFILLLISRYFEAVVAQWFKRVNGTVARTDVIVDPNEYAGFTNMVNSIEFRLFFGI